MRGKKGETESKQPFFWYENDEMNVVAHDYNPRTKVTEAGGSPQFKACLSFREGHFLKTIKKKKKNTLKRVSEIALAVRFDNLSSIPTLGPTRQKKSADPSDLHTHHDTHALRPHKANTFFFHLKIKRESDQENGWARRQQIHTGFPQLPKQMGLRNMGRARGQKRGDHLDSRQERGVQEGFQIGAALPTHQSPLMTPWISLGEPIKP